MTADDGDSRDVMKSERQQNEVACGGDLGKARGATMAAESRADVGQIGFELRAEARSTADGQEGRRR